MIFFSIEFSDYGATIVSKLSISSIHDTSEDLPLYYDHSTWGALAIIRGCVAIILDFV